MEMPTPTNEHRRLEKLAGHYTAQERVQPSKWTEDMTDAQSTTVSRVALDGFAVVQDYEQRQANGNLVKGHGVFRYDPTSDTYELHWFTSMGDPVSVFRGGFEGKVMTLTSRHGGGWMRLVYDFNLRRGYRLRMDMSDDGQHWERIIEGDNLPHAEAASGRGKTAAKKTARSTTGKAVAGRTAAKKPGADRTVAKKTAARKTTRKTAGKKATAKKTAARKTASKKATAKKAVTKKAPAKKTAAKKTAATKRAATGNRIPAAEKRRRQASTKTASASPPRKTTRPLGATARATGTGGVSQQRSKGAAQKGPRMPTVQKSSTRVGWHKTAAKGTRTQ